jgi:hypothetical protein
MEGRVDTPIESCESLCTNTLSLLGSISIYRSRTSMFGLPCDAGTHILSRRLFQQMERHMGLRLTPKWWDIIALLLWLLLEKNMGIRIVALQKKKKKKMRGNAKNNWSPVPPHKTYQICCIWSCC